MSLQPTFWILGGEAPTGPFDAPAVRAKIADGELAWTAKACAVGSSGWKAVTDVPEIAMPSNPPAENTTSIPRRTERRGRAWGVVVVACAVAVVAAVALADGDRSKPSPRAEGTTPVAVTPPSSAPPVKIESSQRRDVARDVPPVVSQPPLVQAKLAISGADGTKQFNEAMRALPETETILKFRGLIEGAKYHGAVFTVANTGIAPVDLVPDRLTVHHGDTEMRVRGMPQKQFLQPLTLQPGESVSGLAIFEADVDKAAVVRRAGRERYSYRDPAVHAEFVPSDSALLKGTVPKPVDAPPAFDPSTYSPSADVVAAYARLGAADPSAPPASPPVPPKQPGPTRTGSPFLDHYLEDEPAAPKPEPNYKGKPLGEWVKMLGADDPATRSDAALALSKLGPDAKDAAKALATALKDPNRDVVRFAALALGSIGDAGVPPLIAGLQDRNEDVQAAARFGLIQSGKAAVPAAVKLLASSTKTTVASATAVLANIGRPAVPALVAALKSDDSQVRGFAALALGEIGKDAKEAIPALRELQADGHAGVRAAAEDAVKKIGR